MYVTTKTTREMMLITKERSNIIPDETLDENELTLLELETTEYFMQVLEANATTNGLDLHAPLKYYTSIGRHNM